MSADDQFDIRQDLEVPPGGVKVVVLLGEGATVSDELASALDKVADVVRAGAEDEVAGFTIFRVDVTKDEPVVVKSTKPDWSWRKW